MARKNATENIENDNMTLDIGGDAPVKKTRNKKPKLYLMQCDGETTEFTTTKEAFEAFASLVANQRTPVLYKAELIELEIEVAAVARRKK